MLASLLAACSEDMLEPAALGEVCGEHGPFRVLALEPGEGVAGVTRLSDRLLLAIGPYREEGRSAPVEERRVWSIGPCGEAPVQLDPSVHEVFTRERWPDVPLTWSDDAGEISVLDPLGVDPPHVVFTGLGAERQSWTDVGVVSVAAVDDATASVLLHPYPDDPRGETSSGTVLYEPLPLRTHGETIYLENFLATDEAVWVVSADHALLRVGLPDGEVSLVQNLVRRFAMAPDRRSFLWQHVNVTGGDELNPAGPILLHDLGAGTDVYIADGLLQTFVWEYRFHDQGLLQIGLGLPFAGPIKVYQLATGESVDLPEYRTLVHVLDERRWLLGTGYDAALDVFDPEDGSMTPLFSGPGGIVIGRDDSVDILAVPRCCGPGMSILDQGRLYRVPFDGSPPRRLADELSKILIPVDDDRSVSVVDIDPDYTGQLVLADLETGELTRIDDRVQIYSVRPLSYDQPKELIYTVSDGERSGLWLARLPGL